MHLSATSIKASGAKFCELQVNYKGMIMPVNVYAAKLGNKEPFSLCVCFEDSPIETRLYINRNEKGEWVELFEGRLELARIIGPMIEAKIKPVLYN